MGSEPTIHLSQSANAFSDVVFIVRIEMLGHRATKNFLGQIRTRDQTLRAMGVMSDHSACATSRRFQLAPAANSRQQEGI